MSERMKLIITEVGERKPFGTQGNTVLQFKALVDGTDKALTFQAFTKGFDGYIQQGAEIDAEIEITEKDDWINRKVVQLFDANGQPIQRKYAGTQRGYGKSAEEIKSIERQVALKCATDIGTGCNPNREEWHPSSILEIADEFYNWLQHKEVQHETTPSDTPKPKSVEKTTESKDKQEGGEAIREELLTAQQVIEFIKRNTKATSDDAIKGWIKKTKLIDLTDETAKEVYDKIQADNSNWL